jgi:glucosamine kinase
VRFEVIAYYICCVSYLIADSGSTKTDWVLLRKGKKPVYFKTGGINPYLQTEKSIADLLQLELKWRKAKHHTEHIFYYGAGASTPDKQQVLHKLFARHFDVPHITVEGDLMAAAKALCGDKKGIVSILGTGSACCYYNGKTVKDQQPSLGFIAGDEGSGNHLGKRILQYYAYNTFDTELRMSFEMLFGNDLHAIINKLYHEPFPNRYLATFVQLLIQNRGHYMVENIIEDCLNDFFHNSILKFRQSWKMPIHFAGSVAYEFKDVIGLLCDQYELELGTVIKSPIEGLVAYYKKRLKKEDKKASL